MADITWTDVVAVAPKLATGVPNASQTVFLAYANERVVATEFGGENSETFTLARAYLAAHLAAMMQQGAVGQSGPVTAESEGGVSRSYAFVQLSHPSILSSTNYGKMFLTLLGQSPAQAGFVA